MRGGARRPYARRTLCTLSMQPRAPTKQMGPFQRPARPTMRLYLQNLRLIDGTGAPPQAGAAIVIERDTLVHVGPLAAAAGPKGPDVETIDLGGRTVIPGLVEAHIHLSYN